MLKQKLYQAVNFYISPNCAGLPKSESSEPGSAPLFPAAFKVEQEETPGVEKTEEDSEVKNEGGSQQGVPVKEELQEKEEQVPTDEKNEEESEQPPYFKYSYMIPESTCTTSITQNGPITLFVARNKRPVKRAPLLECRSPPTTRSRAGGKPVDNTEAEELKCLSEGSVHSLISDSLDLFNLLGI